MKLCCMSEKGPTLRKCLQEISYVVVPTFQHTLQPCSGDSTCSVSSWSHSRVSQNNIGAKICSLWPVSVETLNTTAVIWSLTVGQVPGETVALVCLFSAFFLLITRWRWLSYHRLSVLTGWAFFLDEWETDGIPSSIIYFKSKMN